jgi:cysteinyl-tRNA synthetase
VGNIIKGRDFIERYNAEILKFVILSAHYRSQVDLSDEQVEQSVSGLARIYSSLAWAEAQVKEAPPLAPAPEKFQKVLQEADDGIAEALDDDFNTSEVMARIFEVVRQFNSLCRGPGKLSAEKLAACEAFFHWVKSKGQVMALFQQNPVEYLRKLDDMLLEKKNLVRAEIDKKVTERSQARADKDYALSDKLRDELVAMGIQLRDTAEGTEWEVNK